ncbi:MAG: hypothetical protein A2079_01255 [Geobacteraceae bacterium GWC2_48_7]|nr:MAG: hypothetical protein A2079_01255 [Geobacteraceae bacterium GWC2_48_7]
MEHGKIGKSRKKRIFYRAHAIDPLLSDFPAFSVFHCLDFDSYISVCFRLGDLLLKLINFEL